MAKIRRIIRKVHEGRGDYFDEHQWPIHVALVVLGAFLMGVSAAYLRFSGVPWYANAVTSLLAIPLVVAAFMLAFRYIENHLVRRSLQLSVVLCAILHVALVVHLMETRIFAKLLVDRQSTAVPIERRPPKLVPEYHPSQLLPEEDRPRQDFETPLETRTPEPDPQPEPIVREVPQERQSPEEPQPVPVPEQVPTDQPNVVRRTEPNEAAPRLAAEGSRLSRQSKPSELKISQLIERVPTPAASPTATAQAQPSDPAQPSAQRAEVARSEASSMPAASAAEPQPTTPLREPTAQLARRTEESRPTPDAPAQPTLPRQLATPRVTPRTPVAMAETPSPPRETTPTELQPANVAATRRTVDRPTTDRAAREPAVAAVTEPAPAPRERASPAPADSPAIAATPSPVPNRQPRVTTRPEVATTAIAPAETSGDIAASTPTASPSASRIARSTAAASSPQPSELAASEPQSTTRPEPSASPARTRGEASPTPSLNPTASPTLTRSANAVSLPNVESVADTAAGTIASASASVEPSPSSTATRRSPTEQPVRAPATGEPTPAQLASASPAVAAAQPLARRATSAGSAAADSPVVASDRGSVPTQSPRASQAVANVVTTVGDVSTNTGPQVASSAAVGPSDATVSRQMAPSALDAVRTQPTLEAASQSPASQFAGGTRARAANDRPEAAAVANESTGIARSTATAAAAARELTSAVAATADTGSAAASASNDPSSSQPQPSSLALSRAESGVAGAAQSPNLERSMPAANSPALVASTSARRTEATQSQPAGEALSPSEPARIARAQAGRSVPTSSLAVEVVETGTTLAGNELAEATASASAALTRAQANAVMSDVTAAKGTGEVDIGPVQTIAEAGTGRASGGGAAELKFDTSAPQLARSGGAAGGPAAASTAAAQAEGVASSAAADASAPSGASPTPVALARTVAGGEASASGGPSAAQESGPLAEVNAAQLLARESLSRAEAAEGRSGGEAAAGQPGIEDEEEKARRLARAAIGGSPQPAVAALVAAEAPASPMGEGGDGGTPSAAAEPAAAAIATARMRAQGALPAGGAPADLSPGEGAESGGAERAATLAIARAEAADAAPGNPEMGGGSASPARTAAGPAPSAPDVAEVIAVSSAPDSAGEAAGVPLEATGLTAARLTSGASGAAPTEPVGAAAGAEVVDASSTAAAVSGGVARRTNAADSQPAAVPAAAIGSGPAKQSSLAGLATGDTTVAAIPEIGPTSAVAQADMDHALRGGDMAPMTRSAGEAIAADLEAPEGPAGLASEYSPQVGINTRQAREESTSVQLRSARFVKSHVGGLPSVSTAAIASADAFAARGARKTGSQAGGGRGTPPPQTEEAIERGLAFLARYQSPGGGWSLQGFPEEAQLASDTAATALAVLAFQGAGYNHREHQYKNVVRGGLDYLVQSQQENGDLFVPLDDQSNRSVWLYSHSLAAIALCEAYGMTQDPQLRDPAQRALDFIVASQHTERGGWRYSPGVGSDTSVTGWMMMALKSGELAGLEVPSETYQKIEKWLDGAQQSRGEPHLYRYNPLAPDTPEQRHGRTTSKTMTSVGLLMRLYTGWGRDNASFARGADYLLENLPAIGTPREPQRDTYYWYYGTQVMYHMGGSHWQTWNGRLHPLLVGSQVMSGPQAGSWDPKGPVPDRWGPHGGRLYVTTLNLLSLEVYWRHLPLHASAAAE
jgi:hypothetical protein